MKTLCFFHLIIALALLGTSCLAEPTKQNDREFPEQVFTQWGAALHEVKLSITVTNNQIVAGDDLVVFARMGNLSTNTIYMGTTFAENDFTVFITDEAGGKYRLTRKSSVNTLSMVEPLKPGAHRDWIFI